FSPSPSGIGPGEGLVAFFTPHPNPLPRGGRGLSADVFNFVVRLIVFIFYFIVFISLATVNSYERTLLILCLCKKLAELLQNLTALSVFNGERE
ncbi:hypothetical protein Q2395_26145, partial [Escherichia coli]|nr:hypothetical protein [Escherichia coli]